MYKFTVSSNFYSALSFTFNKSPLQNSVVLAYFHLSPSSTTRRLSFIIISGFFIMLLPKYLCNCFWSIILLSQISFTVRLLKLFVLYEHKFMLNYQRFYNTPCRCSCIRVLLLIRNYKYFPIHSFFILLHLRLKIDYKFNINLNFYLFIPIRDYLFTSSFPSGSVSIGNVQRPALPPFLLKSTL